LEVHKGPCKGGETVTSPTSFKGQRKGEKFRGGGENKNFSMDLKISPYKFHPHFPDRERHFEREEKVVH